MKNIDDYVSTFEATCFSFPCIEFAYAFFHRVRPLSIIRILIVFVQPRTCKVVCYKSDQDQ